MRPTGRAPHGGVPHITSMKRTYPVTISATKMGIGAALRGCRNLSSTSLPPTLTKNTACRRSCGPPAHPSAVPCKQSQRTIRGCATVQAVITHCGPGDLFLEFLFYGRHRGSTAQDVCLRSLMLVSRAPGSGRLSKPRMGWGHLGAQIVRRYEASEVVQLPQKRDGLRRTPRRKGCTEPGDLIATTHLPCQALLAMIRHLCCSPRDNSTGVW